MIIFINGSFGSGKTTIANKLVERIPGALLYDPEEVGFMLRAILKPIDWSGDFQDYAMWRKLVPDIAGLLLDEYNRTLIVPMTIWREDYFKKVTDDLSHIDYNFFHFCLTAPLEVLNERLRARGEQAEGDWVYGQVEKCVKAFESDVFNEKLDTVVLSPDEIVSRIISRCIAE